jgi:hypothetical protein
MNMKTTPSEDAAGLLALHRFLGNWQRMLRHSPDAGQPTQAEIFNHGFREGIECERERAKTNKQIDADTF